MPDFPFPTAPGGPPASEPAAAPEPQPDPLPGWGPAPGPPPYAGPASAPAPSPPPPTSPPPTSPAPTSPAPTSPAPTSPPASASQDTEPRRRKPSAVRGTVEWVVVLAVALLGAFVIRTFLIQAFYIPSESMLPTLQKHDRVLVNKLSYDLHSVHRGDVVVFTHSPGFDPSIKDLIKRVIGLPGETVSGHDGHVFINGHELNEPYLTPGTLTTDFAARVVPAHTYWVMGDNRTNSTDSRSFGPITDKQVVGRAFVLVWPLGRLHLL